MCQNKDKRNSVELQFDGHADEIQKDVTSASPKAINSINDNHASKNEKRKILKNLFTISVSFLFLFTAFHSMQSLQSSINPDEGLGTYSLAALYATTIVSNCFLPVFLNKKLTVKWTLVVTQLGYSLYIAAQFWPQFYTLIPTAVILGLCAAPMWVGQRFYLTRISHRYAEVIKDNSEMIMLRFFGICILFHESSHIWGNVISSAVIGSQKSDFSNMTDEDFAICGASFCPDADNASHNSNLDPPPTRDIYILATVYLIASLLAAGIIAVLLDPLGRSGEAEEGPSRDNSGLQLLVVIFKQMKNPYQLLLIPLSIWAGIEEGIFASEYTRAFISCAYGTQNIGYVLITFGCCISLFPIVVSPLVRYLGRVSIVSFAALCNVAAIVLMFVWQPRPDHAAMFYVIAGIWGIASAVWKTQMNGLYGTLFQGNEEAAFCNLGLWKAMGSTLSYVLNSLTCTKPHLCVATSVLSLGMVCYVILETLHKYNSHHKDLKATQTT